MFTALQLACSLGGMAVNVLTITQISPNGIMFEDGLLFELHYGREKRDRIVRGSMAYDHTVPTCRYALDISNTRNGIIRRTIVLSLSYGRK